MEEDAVLAFSTKDKSWNIYRTAENAVVGFVSAHQLKIKFEQKKFIREKILISQGWNLESYLNDPEWARYTNYISVFDQTLTANKSIIDSSIRDISHSNSHDLKEEVLKMHSVIGLLSLRSSPVHIKNAINSSQNVSNRAWTLFCLEEGSLTNNKLFHYSSLNIKQESEIASFSSGGSANPIDIIADDSDESEDERQRNENNENTAKENESANVVHNDNRINPNVQLQANVSDDTKTSDSEFSEDDSDNDKYDSNEINDRGPISERHEQEQFHSSVAFKKVGKRSKTQIHEDCLGRLAAYGGLIIEEYGSKKQYRKLLKKKEGERIINVNYHDLKCLIEKDIKEINHDKYVITTFINRIIRELKETKNTSDDSKIIDDLTNKLRAIRILGSQLIPFKTHDLKWCVAGKKIENIRKIILERRRPALNYKQDFDQIHAELQKMVKK